MLVTEPIVVWLLVKVSILAISFVTTTLASDCFVKSFPAHAVFERSTEGVLKQFRRIFFWRSGNMSG